MASLGQVLAARQLAAAAAVGVLLVAAVGPGPVGWIAGIMFTVVMVGLLADSIRRAGAVVLGPADLVTLLRATLIAGITALVADGLATGFAPVAVLVALSSVALALDAVDGQVARRTRTVSALGARFDMEADAALLMVLSVHVSVLLGPWVLAIGLIRYVFVAVSWVLPWLGATLRPHYWAKTIAALQGIVLVVATSQLLTPLVAIMVVAGSLALLIGSFAYDIPRLWHLAHRPQPEPAP